MGCTSCIRCRHAGGPTNKANRSANDCMKWQSDVKSLLINRKKTNFPWPFHQTSVQQIVTPHGTTHSQPHHWRALSVKNGQCCNVRRRRCSMGAVALKTRTSAYSSYYRRKAQHTIILRCLTMVGTFSVTYTATMYGVTRKGLLRSPSSPHGLMKMKPFPTMPWRRGC
jgi:hypothetical protein